MKEMGIVLKEQFVNWRIIGRMARYEQRSTFQTHYLGLAWEILNPTIQILTYWVVFGTGLRGNGLVHGVPYINWMLFGMCAWFFINASLLGGSKSVYTQVGLVSKMKFPVSILPTINMASNFTMFFTMMGVSIVWALLNGIAPSIYWIQGIYYFIAMVALIVSMGILNSTVSMLVRDYHIVLQSVLRLLFYLSGTIMNIEPTGKLKIVGRVLEINPFVYLTNGFRDSFLYHKGFWLNPNATIMYWSFVLFILMVGSHIHLKFRARFVDFV